VKLLLATLFSFCVMLAAVLLASLVTYMSNDPTSLSDIASLIALLFSAAVSSFTVAAVLKESRFLISSLSSLLLVLILMLSGVVMSGGALPPKLFLNYICYMGIALFFSYLGTKKQPKKHRR